MFNLVEKLKINEKEDKILSGDLSGFTLNFKKPVDFVFGDNKFLIRIDKKVAVTYIISRDEGVSFFNVNNLISIHSFFGKNLPGRMFRKYAVNTLIGGFELTLVKKIQWHWNFNDFELWYIVRRTLSCI